MKDHFIPRCKFCKPCFYIIKNTGNIKQQTQYDIDHVGQVLYKYAKMCHNRTASEREQKQGQHDRDHVQNIKADRHAVNDHHNDHDAKRDQHFKAVYKHADHNQNVFRQIYFCHNGLVVFDDFYALLKGLIKEIPHRQTDKNENCKILLFCIKYHTKDQGVDQHETDRIQYPPQPVQVGTCHLRLQFRFCRIDRVLVVLFRVF